MAPITLANLNKVSLAGTQRAGPRYTPTIDASAPNLQIRSLMNAIEALAHSSVYKTQLDDLEVELRDTWKAASAEILALFDKRTSASELCSTLVRQLKQEGPGSSVVTLGKIRRTLERIEAQIRPYREALHNQRFGSDQSTETRNKVAGKIDELQKFGLPIGKLREFVESPDFALVQNNRLFLRGGWGAGKTHLLCDITKARAERSLPTLLLLAQSFARGVDPLLAACQVSGIAPTPGELLGALETKRRSGPPYYRRHQ
jgi:hypothetical protein